MQCVTPLFRLYDISSNQTIRMVPRSEVMEGLLQNPNNIKFQLQKMNSKYLARNQLIQTIPCRNCWACQLNNSAEWATRNMCESLDHDQAYFITLTYDEEHLPILEKIPYIQRYEFSTHMIEITDYIENDGTWITGSLFPKDVELFLKNLRQFFKRHNYNKPIRYFYCGEYGQLGRPHYHMLLYGAPIAIEENYDWHIDKKFFKEHWKNPLIDHFWEHGLHDIANLEWSNAAYTSRYCMKKISNEPNSDLIYAEMGKIKEFIRMSRMPGIGANYYNAHKFDIYKTDSMIMKTVKGNTGSFKPPKAFDKWFKEEFPDDFKKIEKHRKEMSERSRRNDYRLSDYTDYEKLIMKAEKVATKNNMLPREGEWEVDPKDTIEMQRNKELFTEHRKNIKKEYA